HAIARVAREADDHAVEVDDLARALGCIGHRCPVPPGRTPRLTHGHLTAARRVLRRPHARRNNAFPPTEIRANIDVDTTVTSHQPSSPRSHSMTASSAPTDLPASSLSVSRPVADHDLVARIARGHNMLRHTVHGRPDVIALARELAEW